MIDTKVLRSRILDLAIQGKLTEQFESETVDSEDNTTIIEFLHSIPSNWKWTTIENIISKDVGGGTPSKSVSEYWENGSIPWMSVKDFSSAQNGILEDTIDHITQAGLENSSSNLVDSNAIIICMRMALGKIVKLKKPMAINQDLRAIWLKPYVDNDYFVYFYSTLKVEGHGMTVAGISKKQLMNYPFPLPPLAEQKRIVQRVEEIFRVLNTIDVAQEKYSADVEILKAKLITAGIQGKLTQQLDSDGTAEELYQQIQKEKQKLIKEGKIKKEKPLPPIKDEEIPFEIPSNWKWVRLNEISEKITSGSTPPGGKKGNAYVKQGYCFFREQNIYNDGIHMNGMVYITEELLNTRQNSTVIAKDILLNITGGSIGRCAIIPDDFTKGSINQHILIIRLVNEDMRYFIHQIMCSPYVQKLIKSKAVGDKDGFSGGRCKTTLVPLPPIAEQKRIADRLGGILSLFENLK